MEIIPSVNDILSVDLTIEEPATIQHKMSNGRIIGECDQVDALKQTIFKILNTERYAYGIYSWDYGVELADLIGEPVTYCCPEIERRVTEALMMDERITSVDGFTFDIQKHGSVAVAFTVHSIYGDINEEKVVNI